jgi:hypothetical protein
MQRPTSGSEAVGHPGVPSLVHQCHIFPDPSIAVILGPGPCSLREWFANVVIGGQAGAEQGRREIIGEYQAPALVGAIDCGAHERRNLFDRVGDAVRAPAQISLGNPRPFRVRHWRCVAPFSSLWAMCWSRTLLVD